MFSHDTGFEYEWQGNDLVYRSSSCCRTFIWVVSKQKESVNQFLPDTNQVRKFVDRALNKPDEYIQIEYKYTTSEHLSVEDLLGDFTTKTTVVEDEIFCYANLNSDTQTDTAVPKIIFTYDNPMISSFQIIVSGTMITGRDESLRVINQKVENLTLSNKTLVEECTTLRENIRDLKNIVRDLNIKLDDTITRLGGEGAIVYHGNIVHADQIKKLIPSVDYRPINKSDFPGVKTATSICNDMDICPIHVILKVSVYIHGVHKEYAVEGITGRDDYYPLQQFLEDIGSKIESLEIQHAGGKNYKEYCHLDFPYLPNLQEIDITGLKIENIDCMNRLADCKGLKLIKLSECDFSLPVLGPSVRVQR
jgi:hypothetical protein